MIERITTLEKFKEESKFCLRPGALYKVEPIRAIIDHLGGFSLYDSPTTSFILEQGDMLLALEAPKKKTIALRESHFGQHWTVVFLAGEKQGTWTLFRSGPVDYKEFLYELNLNLIQIK